MTTRRDRIAEAMDEFEAEALKQEARELNEIEATMQETDEVEQETQEEAGDILQVLLGADETPPTEEEDDG